MRGAVEKAPVAEHALLSASGSHRWLRCTPSARLEETLPETTSRYAEEGRLAHEIAELKLRKQFIEPMGQRAFASKLSALKKSPLYQEEMLPYTEVYFDYISSVVHSFSQKPFVAIERRLDFSTYVPDSFGTGDCIIIGGTDMYVIDLKYGKGVPVDAAINPQMMLYALGALLEYSFLYDIRTVHMAIVQPRLSSTSEFEMATADLMKWGEEIKPIAQKAYAGEGEYVPGDHCRFCRAKATCRARMEQNLGLTKYRMMEPPIVSNEEVGDILKQAEDLEEWVKALKEYALAESLAGNDIPGWKAVHGRSNRMFDDSEAVFKTLIESGTEEAMLYERKPLTLAAIEKMLTKKRFTELVGNHVVSQPGKPTLVPATDKREPIHSSSATDDFKENGGNENE